MNFKNKFQLQIISSNNSSINNLIIYLMYAFKQNKICNLQIQNIHLPLKVKKFTLLKSPHIFKTARTQLEIRKLKRVVTIENFKGFNEIRTLKEILEKVIKSIPATIHLKIKSYTLTYI